jgi:flagellar assembly factor FliW
MSQPEITDALPTRIDTRFGTFESPADTIIRCPEGLPGFERCRRFVLVSSADLSPLQCLHGLDAPQPSFLVIDPLRVLPTYRCVLGPADRRRLDAAPDEALVWLAIVTIGDGEQSTANLRAPVVINPRRMLGCQVMPHQSLYPVAFPLNEG